MRSVADNCVCPRRGTWHAGLSRVCSQIDLRYTATHRLGFVNAQAPVCSSTLAPTLHQHVPASHVYCHDCTAPSRLLPRTPCHRAPACMEQPAGALPDSEVAARCCAGSSSTQSVVAVRGLPQTQRRRAVTSRHMPKGRKARPGLGKPAKRSSAAKSKQGQDAAQTPASAVSNAKQDAVGALDVASPLSAAASPLSQGAPPPPIGLVNLGHTCYFNAMLQARQSEASVLSCCCQTYLARL